MAYQIAFDLYENATQQFINKIIAALNEQTDTERYKKDLVSLYSLFSKVPASPADPSTSTGASPMVMGILSVWEAVSASVACVI